MRYVTDVLLSSGLLNNDKFCNSIICFSLTPHFEAFSSFRQRKFSQPSIQKQSCRSCPEVRPANCRLLHAKHGFLRQVAILYLKRKDKSKDLFVRFVFSLFRSLLVTVSLMRPKYARTAMPSGLLKRTCMTFSPFVMKS